MLNLSLPSDNEYFCYQGLKDGHELKSSGATMTVSLRSKVNFKLFLIQEKHLFEPHRQMKFQTDFTLSLGKCSY